MYLIGVLNSKGGVGKSTLTSALAVRASKDSRRVAILDLDPQRSTAAWWNRRGSPNNPTLFRGAERASEAVEGLELNGYDWVFMDGPPGSLEITEDAITVADFVIVPMRPSALDLEASQACISACEDEGVPFVVVINFATGDKDKLAAELRATIEGEIPVANTMIVHRRGYVTAMSRGATASEKEGAEKNEIDALWKEIKAATIKAAKSRKKRG